MAAAGFLESTDPSRGRSDRRVREQDSWGPDGGGKEIPSLSQAQEKPSEGRGTHGWATDPEEGRKGEGTPALRLLGSPN